MDVSPGFQQQLPVLGDQLDKSIQLVGSKAVVARKRKRLEPELGFAVIPFHMNVWRFPRFATVKVKSVRTNSENRRHFVSALRRGF
jgi:hypothetical protein